MSCSNPPPKRIQAEACLRKAWLDAGVLDRLARLAFCEKKCTTMYARPFGLFRPQVDRLVIGGGMVFTFLKARGLSVGSSLVEDDKLDLVSDHVK